jgi:hypothetical protein
MPRRNSITIERLIASKAQSFTVVRLGARLLRRETFGYAD